MRLTIIIFLVTAVMACTSRKVPYSEGMAMVKSINGEVMYQFDTTTREVRQVIKFSQTKNGYYVTFIKRDTVEQGEDFTGVVVLNKEGEIHIKQPLDTLISDGKCSLNWTANEMGEREFKGTVKINDEEFPFEWKFIVVPAGQRTNILKFEEEVVIHHGLFRF